MSIKKPEYNKVDEEGKISKSYVIYTTTNIEGIRKRYKCLTNYAVNLKLI